MINYILAIRHHSLIIPSEPTRVLRLHVGDWSFLSFDGYVGFQFLVEL